MSRQFTGKTAFITGGGSGIGRAAALALAAQGCTVTIAGKVTRTLEYTARQIIRSGGSARFVTCDVADEESVAYAVRAAIGDSGRLDFAINSAGTDAGGPELSTEYPRDKFDRLMATNVRGVFLAMKHELLQMQRQGFGAIINIVFGAGLVGVPGHAAFSASKGAEIGMTKSAALEFAEHGIRINAVCPGLVDTPRQGRNVSDNPGNATRPVAAHPVARIAGREVIVDAIVYLCSERSNYLIGAALPLDGGDSAH